MFLRIMDEYHGRLPYNWKAPAMRLVLVSSLFIMSNWQDLSQKYSSPLKMSDFIIYHLACWFKKCPNPLSWSKACLRYDIWWGKSARIKYSSGVAKPATVTISWFLICWTPLFYERWTRPPVFRLRSPPPNVIQAGLTLSSVKITVSQGG
jgi:hypothetical protein